MTFYKSVTTKSFAAVLALTFATSSNLGQVYAGSCCGSGSCSSTTGATMARSSGPRLQRPDPPFLAPHGGQLTRTSWNYFEVVYSPQETRVYCYDIFRSANRVKGVHGTVKMRVRSTGSEFNFPLQHVPSPSGQDYLAAEVDLSRVRQGDMDAEFEINNLPNQADSIARFTQVYGELASSSLPNEQIPSNDMRQFAEAAPSGGCRCGVKGSCGMCGDVPSKLTAPPNCCSQGLAAERNISVPANPYAQGPGEERSFLLPLPPVDEPGRSAEQTSSWGAAQVTAEPVTPADEEAVLMQRVCPVTNQVLGSHGAPIKLTVNGQSLFVCCQGCVESVRENPEKYLALVAK